MDFEKFYEITEYGNKNWKGGCVMKVKIDRRESKKYLQNLINRCYDNNDPFTWKDYFETELEFHPLNLSQFNLVLEETKNWIDRLFDDYETNQRGNFMLRGFTGSDAYGKAEVIAKKLNITEKNYPSSYSWYGFNSKEMMIFTWCEGDMTLELFNDREIFEKEKTHTINWYKEAYS